MTGTGGELVMLFNHGKDPATVNYTFELTHAPKSVRELTVGNDLSPGKRFTLQQTIPATSVRIYRIDY